MVLRLSVLIMALMAQSNLVCSQASGNKMIEGKKPLNVLLITSDDLGKQLSCYGDDVIQTPNIDRLASRGIMFRNGYVSQASCSPSRSSILTGTYPHTNGQLGLAHSGFQLNKEYPNIAKVLKGQGYKTGIIGKLHVNPENQFPFDFDKKNYQQARDVELVANRVDSFITATPEKPFFMYLNYTDPHVPLYRSFAGHPLNPVNPSDVHAFNFQGVDDPGELQRIADYYSCVRRLDEGIGLLMKKLEKLKVLDNTLIIFVGDHGAPFARGKGAGYESSVNIPYFVSCPKFIQEKQESEALVSTVDIFPTILDVLGYRIPEEVQGKSLLPVLKKEKPQVRKYLFTEFNFHGNSINSFYPRRAVRDGRYKLILNLVSPIMPNSITGIDGDKAYSFAQTPKYEGTWVREVFDRLKSPPKIELFDLQKDPFEKNDLSGDASLHSKKEELLNQVLKWMETTNDPFLKAEDLEKKIKSLPTQEK